MSDRGTRRRGAEARKCCKRAGEPTEATSTGPSPLHRNGADRRTRWHGIIPCSPVLHSFEPANSPAGRGKCVLAGAFNTSMFVFRRNCHVINLSQISCLARRDILGHPESA